MFSYLLSEFTVDRADSTCIRCRVCERQCANKVHHYDGELDMMFSDVKSCVGCQRCVVLCPTGALTVRPRTSDYRPNSRWTRDRLQNLKNRPKPAE